MAAAMTPFRSAMTMFCKPPRYPLPVVGKAFMLVKCIDPQFRTVGQIGGIPLPSDLASNIAKGMTQRRPDMWQINIGRMNVLIQRAAPKNIEHLRTPANTQHRHILDPDVLQQLELHFVAGRIDAHIKGQVTPVNLSSDIIASPDDETVEFVDPITIQRSNKSYRR